MAMYILTRVIVKVCQRDMLLFVSKYGIKCSGVSLGSVKLSVCESETFSEFVLCVLDLYAFYYFLSDLYN